MTSLLKMAEPVGQLLKDRGQTVAVAESAAGGLVCAALLSVPGASAYFLGGASVYTQTARRALLRFDDTKAQMRGSIASMMWARKPAKLPAPAVPASIIVVVPQRLA